jgi:hypothetical protein
MAIALVLVGVAVVAGILVTKSASQQNTAPARVFVLDGSGPVLDGQQVIARARIYGQLRIVAIGLDGQEHWRLGPLGDSAQLAMRGKDLLVSDAHGELQVIDLSTGLPSARSQLGQAAKAACTTTAGEARFDLVDGSSRLVNEQGVRTGSAPCQAPAVGFVIKREGLDLIEWRSGKVVGHLE